ncbi:MAG: SurA N-terminal domain-containing protein [Candidatus Bipolaricaulota bacterium]|nr:SurA N-terminal domain-containing protein [Candidatus Bipolaricaulota bacterium]
MKKVSLLLLVGLLLTSLLAFSQDTSTPADTQTQSSKTAATVNGEQITTATLENATGMSQIFQILFSQLPQAFGQSLLSTPEGKAFLDRYQRDVLDQIIDSRIMVQQAVALDMKADESQVADQVQSHLDQIMQQNQMTIDQIDAALVQQGSSLDDYKTRLALSIREQLMVQALQESVTADVTVSDDEVQEYYEAHQTDYTNDDGTVKPLSEVSASIHDNLLNAAQANRWNAWFKDAKDSSEITILF